MDNNHTDTKFNKYMADVAAVMDSIVGLEPDDIEDYDYRDAFDRKVKPVRCAMLALENAGYDDDVEYIR